MTKKAAVEDVYPLTPLQEGLLFHSVYAPGGGQYHDQFSAVLRGPLQPAALAEAWPAVVAALPILRTAFSWQAGGAPLQVVVKHVEAPLRLEDWRQLSPADQAARRAEFMAEDVRLGFDLARPPLTRATLIRLADDAWFFLWSRHHLLLDGWSVTLVLRAWLAAYAERVRGGTPAIAVPRPFKEYVEWLKRQDEVRTQAFWRAELGDLEEPAALGLALPPGSAPPAEGPRHGEIDLELGEAESEALSRLARSAQVTLATVFQGAWALLLARLSGERDVVFGQTVSGRPSALPGVETMVGLFINTLPLRLRVRPDEPLDAWLRAGQERASAAREFEHTPLVKIHGWSGVARDHPLFESLLVVENYPAGQALAGTLGEVRVEEARSHERTHYPVTLIAAPGARIGLRLLHDRARLTDAHAARWMSGLRTLLGAMARGARQPVGRLGVLAASDEERILTEWNATGRARDESATLSGLVAAQAARTPRAVAVVDERDELTYGELMRRVRELAARLRAAGAGPERCVGVCLERSVDLVVALLGVLESGAAYVPLDPAYPQDRLAFMAADARLAALVTRRGLEDRLPAQAVPTVWIDGPPAGAGGPAVAALPANLAYLIYTSGSTGKPKATAIEHRQAAALVQWALTVFSADELKGVLFSTSMCFDLSVFEVFVTLAAGGKVIVAENALVLPAHPRRGEVTLLNTVPSAAAELARQEAIPPSVATICLAGEPLSAALADRLYSFPQVRRVCDLYGPSEDTTYSTFAQRVRGKPATIGRVIDNSRLYLLDEDLQPAPVGAIGEIHLAGAGLARGYLGRADLTAERFAPDPYSPDPGGRLYRTGDLARFREDGQLEYLGRRDHQVKIRGFRIELGEIQARLEAHPEVAEAAVLAREHPTRGKYLAAFVAPKAAAAPAVERLAAWIRETLPAYMMPSAWHLLPQLPRTPNGKLDRRALPADATDSGSAAAEHAPRPADPVDEILAGIWAQVLGVGSVRPGDNFFELGGHSLLATQAVARVRKALQAEIPLRALFDHPTLGGFAAAVRATRLGGEEQGEPVQRRPEGEEPPLSFAQERMWTIARIEPDSPAYNVPAVLEATGALDLPALRRALETVVARHEVLRMSFPERDGLPRVAVGPAGALAVPLEDLRGLAEPERTAAARRIAAEEGWAPFDLARGPLLRARLLQLEANRHWLLLTVHHVATDGWSEWILVRELAAAYAGRELDDPAIGYGDYALWQRRRAGRGELARQVAWWKEELQEIPVLELPVDGLRPSTQNFHGAVVTGWIGEVEVEKLRGLARAEGATLFMALLAAWEVWLWRHSGQSDFGVGVPVAGRTRPELEGMIGLFVNTVVVRSDIATGIGFAELVRRVRERTLRAFDRQEAPFEQIVEAVQPRRELGRTPLFQVMFALQNTPRAELDLGAVRIEPVEVETKGAKFELRLTAVENRNGTVGLSLEYSRDLFGEETALRFLARYGEILRSVTAGTAAALRDISWVPAAEEARLAAWSRGPALDFDRAGWMHRLPDRQPASRLAVVGPDGRALTYGQFCAEAERLARSLRGLGIGPEIRVAVCLERSVELVVALHAVLRAGGVYVPLDTSYPPDRLAWMLSNTAASLILTTRELAARFTTGAARPFYVEEPWPEGPAGPAPILGDQAAYVIYTSGSTGRPKGCLNTHAGILNQLQWMNVAFPLAADDVLLQKTASSFDPSIYEFFWPLMFGASVAVAEPGAHRDPARLVELIIARKATTANFVPSMLRALLETPGVERCTSLRRIFASGEELPRDVVEKCAAVLPGCALHNLYGPTEVSIESTHHICIAGTGRVPLGRPMANLEVHVLDTDMRRAPCGVGGEVYIGGVGLGRGYEAQPDLTAQAWLPSPFSAGGRLYRTGDLARVRDDGQLEFLGRADFQIKLRGYRIELGEIESVMLAYPGVEKAAVALRGGRLVAYLQWPDAPADWQDRLVQALEARVPQYMVPAVFMALPQWPVTPTGKINRRGLPEPALPAAEAAAFEAPAGPVETLLAGLWVDLLRVKRVSRRDNFFAIGGDSILALQVSARAAVAGVRVPAQAVFMHQTLAELAAATQGAPAAPGGAGAKEGEEVPLTPIQQWFFEQDFAQPEHWNQSALFVTPPDFDPVRFEAALRRVAGRHEALQLRYMRGAGGWTARRGSAEEGVAFATAALADLPAAAARAQAGLDPVRGPLLRAVHFSPAGKGEGRLLLAAHHLAVDGVSWRVLLEELAGLYAVPDQPLPPVQSWSRWVRALAAEAGSAGTRAEAPWWRSVPGAAPLPRDASAPGRGAEAEAAVAHSVLTVEETTTLLRETAADRHAQVNEILLSALVRVLREWTGASGQTLALEGHGREAFPGSPSVESAVGWFTSLFPVRFDLAGAAADPGAALKAVKDQLRAVPRHGFGYGLLRYLGSREIRAELGSQPWPELCFNFLGQLDSPTLIEGFRAASEPRGADHGPGNRRPFLLEINAAVRDGALDCAWSYSRAHHHHATVQRLADRFAEELRGYLAPGGTAAPDPSSPSDFSVPGLSQSDLDKVLARQK